MDHIKKLDRARKLRSLDDIEQSRDQYPALAAAKPGEFEQLLKELRANIESEPEDLNTQNELLFKLTTLLGIWEKHKY